MNSALSVIDLFCGAGGFTKGFVDVGFAPIWANDFDYWSTRTYEANFGRHVEHGPIETFSSFPQAEVVIGGPPCQGFSNLGKRLPDDPRNQLWRHYLRVVEACNAKVFVVENVPPLLKSGEFAEMVRIAQQMGFAVPEFGVLNAANFGVPQTRKRAIAIFSRIGAVGLPQATHFDSRKTGELALGLQGWVSVKEALMGIPKAPLHWDVDGTETPLSGSQLHIGRTPTAKSLRRYSYIPEGGNRWNLPRELTPDCWVRKTEGGTDLFGRLWNARPAFTIRTEFFKPEKGRYLHPTADRPITHWEAARLQTFPDSFKFHGTKIAIARQIGNAVPCLLGSAIALRVKARLEAPGAATVVNRKGTRRPTLAAVE